MTSSSYRTARASAPWATPYGRTTLKAPWRHAPTRRRPIIPHDRRRTTHRRAAFRYQDRRGCDLLSVNLTAAHVFGRILCTLRRCIVNVAKTSSKRLATIKGEVYGADLSERTKNLQNVILCDVPGQTANVYSCGSRSK